MTAAQRAFGGLLLLTVAFSILYFYLLEAAAQGLAPSPGLAGEVETRVLDLAHSLPYVLTPYLIAQPFLLLVWAIRVPRVADPAHYRLAVLRLGEWLKWIWAIAGLFAAGVVVAIMRGSLLAVFFMSLLPLFGVAYSVAVYRSLQVNQYWQERGSPGFSTRSLALGAMLPTMVILMWPLGLLIPAGVWRRYRLQEAL